MSELPVPVKTALRETTTSTSVARMWGRIEARGRMRAPSSGVRRWVLVPAIALVASAAIAFVSSMPRHGAPGSGSHAIPALTALTPRSTPSITPPPAPITQPTGPRPIPVHEAVIDPASHMERAPARPKAAPPVPAPAETHETWRELAARGQNDQAYAELGRDGIVSAVSSASVDDLFALADVARLSGHAAEAVPPLQRIVSEHRTDVRTPLAALTLGRVQLRSLGVPGDAVRSLDTAIALGLPAGLAEDADALLVEACSRAGQRERARTAYETYVRAFPAGSKRTNLERWVAQP